MKSFSGSVNEIETISSNLTVPSNGGDSRNLTECISGQQNRNVTEFEIPKITLNENSTVNGKSPSAQELILLKEMNRKFAHIIVGGKHKVASKISCPEIGNDITLEGLNEFKNRFLTEPKVVGLNKGEAWLKWSGKVFKPDGMNYYPNEKQCPSTVYNLYEGLAVSGIEGDIEPFLYHLRMVICSNDLTANNYVLGFLAHLVQKPMEKPGVAIVLKSVEGTGKGAFFEALKRVFGTHASQINGAYQLTGRFNSVVANQQLVFADEVNLTDPRTADKIKGLITEPRVCLERKGIDPIHVPSYVRFIFASNHDQVLKAGERERRFIVLDVSDKHIQDKIYFDRYWDWLENGGPASLLYFLTHYDLSRFDPRRAPITKALLDEKLQNLAPCHQFIFEELQKAKPFDGAARLSTQDMVNKCRIWLEDNGYQFPTPKIRSLIGKLIQKMEISKDGKHGRDANYELPLKEAMQAKFARMLGHKKTDIFN